MTEQNVYIWDKFVRIFHWSLVGLFLISYLTGDEESSLHIYSGYAVVTLVLARILWGFIGSRHARFRDFIYSPATIAQYGRDFIAGHPKHYLGHNPLGGLMVVALLLNLLVITYSGLKLYAVEEGKGPLAQQGSMALVSAAQADDDDDDDREGYRAGKYGEAGEDEEGEEFWEDLHEASVNLMILLILLHVAGVIISTRLHGESLVKAMISGYKRREPSE